MADVLYQKIRILCWVMTGPYNLQSRAHHVRATWSRHCNMVVFMSSVKDTDFPTVGLGTKEGRDQLYWKTIRAFHYVYEHHADEADWFLKADDDTYVVVDNLRWILSNHTPEQPIYFGKRFKPYTKQGYMSGGAGYVLSKEALRRFVEGFRTKVCTHTTPVEDLALGQCLEKMGVLAGDSRDTLHRENFSSLCARAPSYWQVLQELLVLELLLLSNRWGKSFILLFIGKLVLQNGTPEWIGQHYISPIKMCIYYMSSKS